LKKAATRRTYRGGRAVDAVRHGHDPDDPAPELPTALPRGRCRALGLIGVVAALLPSGAPLGFVAILGVLALIGILIRNSVILIMQIEHLIIEGVHPWDAVIEASEHRMRPIALTAAAASLALIPIAREVFWGRWPMR
jgi:multidrug efflux pump subunit AcrB